MMVLFRSVFISFIILAAFSAGLVNKADAQSFSCKSVRLQAEKAICAGRWLSQLDQRLDQAYRHLKSRLRGRKRHYLARSQIKWLRARNQCLGNRRCLRSQYLDRLAEIEGELARLDGRRLVDHPGPSFDCSGPRRAAEITICTYRNIANLDRRLAGIFSDALRKSRSNDDRRNLRHNQAQWIKSRDACRFDRPCLRRSYNSRINYLQGVIADLISRPDVKPSFNCRYVKLRSEKTICRSARLAKLDVENDSLFKRAINRAPSRLMRKDLTESEKKWLVHRDRCGADKECLTDSYFARMIYLGNILYYYDARSKSTHSGTSFDCGTVHHAAERKICASKNLSRLDRQLAGVYGELRKEIPRGARAMLVQEQSSWLSDRNSCVEDGRCLRRKYRKRISEIEAQLEVLKSKDWRRRATVRPSFNCNLARLPAEAAVCDNGTLAQLDREMAAAYYSFSNQVSNGRKRARLKSQQKQWLVRRNRCGYRVNCLIDLYERRLYQLETALGG